MPSANQFTTGPGAGFDPDEDQRQRSLASEVNSGQGLPNLDPGKVGNPYPAGTPNPYQAPVPFVGNSGGATRAPAPAAGAAPATQPQEAVRRQAASQAAAPQQTAPPQLSVSPTGTYKPIEMDAYGKSLEAAARGQRTGDQMQAERIAADDYYKDNANAAAESSAAGGGVGRINRMATQIAQAGRAARVQTAAADTAAARTAYNQYRQGEVGREQGELEREVRRRQLEQELELGHLGQETARRGQDLQADAAEKQRKIDRERNIINSVVEFFKAW